MDLTRLAVDARDGSASAREELLLRIGPLVYARILHTLSGREAANDVAQEVLLAVMQGLPGLREPQALLGWVRRILDHTLSRHLLRQKAAPAELDGLILADVGSPGPHEAAVQEEQRRHIRSAVASLSPRSRAAIELFHFHDLTCRQVADFLGISEGATRASLRRARQQLRSYVMTSACDSQQERHWTMIVSGDSTFYGGLFEHGSDADRIYRHLYPAGSEQSLQGLGLAADRRQEQTRSLEEAGLLVRSEAGWRCTMPVVRQTDLEVMRVWAARVAEVVISQLDDLHQRLEGLQPLAEGGDAAGTVMTFGLLEAAGRPFRTMLDQLSETDPSRGRLGSFRITLFECPIPGHAEFIGGTGISHRKDDVPPTYSYWYWPHGTRRELVRSFLKRMTGDVRAERVLDALAPYAWSGIGPEDMDRIAHSLCASTERAAEFWEGLVRLHAVEVLEGSARVILPHLPRGPWEEYLARPGQIGAQLEEQVAGAADDLRNRAAHCSFADCNFEDAVLAFWTVLDGLVKESISHRNWVTLPAEADFA